MEKIYKSLEKILQRKLTPHEKHIVRMKVNNSAPRVSKSPLGESVMPSKGDRLVRPLPADWQCGGFTASKTLH